MEKVIIWKNNLKYLLRVYLKEYFKQSWWDELFFSHLKNIWEVEFDEIESFIKDEEIDNEVRGFLCSRIPKWTRINKKIIAIFEDEKVDLYIKIQLSERVLWPNVSEEVIMYLNNTEIGWEWRLALAQCLVGVYFDNKIFWILSNEKIEVDVRIGIINAIDDSKVDKKLVYDFITRESINIEVRSYLVYILKEIEFNEDIYQIFEHPYLEEEILTSIADICVSVPLNSRVLQILSNQNLHFEVRVNLAAKIQNISCSNELLIFLANEKIYFAVRSVIARKTNITLWTPEIQDFLNRKDIDFNVRRNLYSRILQNTEVNFWEILDWLTPWGSWGKEVNKYQIWEIIWKNWLLEVPQKRTLNFYFREMQWSFLPHFEVISDFIKFYIDNWFSKVWSEYRVITRNPWENKLGNSKWMHDSHMGFRALSSIYADTIHITHGTPESQIPGTHFILWKAITQDEWDVLEYGKIDTISQEQYTELDLDYFWGNTWYFTRDWNWKFDSWIPNISMHEILKKVLSALINAEEKIIQNSKTPQKKVFEILNT